MNTFNYRGIYNLGEWVYKWEVVYDNHELSGTCSSVNACYRSAKKAVKKYKKMMAFLNPDTNR